MFTREMYDKIKTKLEDPFFFDLIDNQDYDKLYKGYFAISERPLFSEYLLQDKPDFKQISKIIKEIVVGQFKDVFQPSYTLEIYDRIFKIGAYSFMNAAFYEVVLPKDLETVEEYAFANFDPFNGKLEIPEKYFKNIEEISSGAFIGKYKIILPISKNELEKYQRQVKTFTKLYSDRVYCLDSDEPITEKEDE